MLKLDKNVNEFLTQESLQVARQVRNKLLNGEEIDQPYQQEFLKKDGTIRIVNMTTSLVVIDGEIKGFQHIARDVTEEKIAEEMLSKIIDGSPIPSFVINKQHIITHWNTAIASLSGISAKEIIGTDEGIFGCMGLLGCEDVCPKNLPLQDQLGILRRKMGWSAVKQLFRMKT